MGCAPSSQKDTGTDNELVQTTHCSVAPEPTTTPTAAADNDVEYECVLAPDESMRHYRRATFSIPEDDPYFMPVALVVSDSGTSTAPSVKSALKDRRLSSNSSLRRRQSSVSFSDTVTRDALSGDDAPSGQFSENDEELTTPTAPRQPFL